MSNIKVTTPKDSLLKILTSPVSVDEVVNNWISLYKECPNIAIQDLFQLLFDASGHNKILTNEIMQDNEPRYIVESFRQSLPQDVEPPISKPRVCVCLAVFIQRLLQKCNVLIFDSFLLDKFFSFLVPMTRSTLRVFRYVGTLAGLKAMTTLVNFLQMYTEKLNVAKIQFRAEEAKSDSSQSSDRMEVLENNIQEFQQYELELKTILNDFLLKVLFKTRIMDKFADVQILCIKEAVLWMEMCPDMFLNDYNLVFYKYFMRSPSPNVRQAILHSLGFLYEKKEYKEILEVFTQRSLSDVVLMTLDKSLPVSVLALALLTKILVMYGPEILDEEKEKIFRLIFSQHQNVACGSATFLNAWLEKETKKTNHVTIIKNLVTFFKEARLPDHAEFFVDALLGCCPALLNWEALHEVLMRMTGTSEDEISCLKVVSATVELACTGRSPRMAEAEIPMSTKKVKLRMEHKKHITMLFTEHLPRLLHKYRDDEEKILLLFPIVMNLRIDRIMPSNESILKSVVKCLEKITEIHSDKQILRGCCDIMKYIKEELSKIDDGYSVSWFAESQLLAKFLQSDAVVQKCFRKNLKLNSDHIFTLTNALDKLVVFFEYGNQTCTELWNVCYNYIEKFQKSSMFPMSFIINCIKLCHLMVLQEMTQIELESEESVRVSEVSLQSKVMDFLSLVQNLLVHEAHDVCKLAYFVTSDILLIERCSPLFRILRVSANSTLHSLLGDYVARVVFKGDYIKKVKKGINVEYRKSVFLSYCKLISHGILEIHASSWIFKHYDSMDDDFAEIFNRTFLHMLHLNKLESARALMKGLVYQIDVLMKAKKNVNKQSVKRKMREKFDSCIKLLITSPEALMHFHGEGISFAYEQGHHETQNQIVLEMLSELIETLTPVQLNALNEVMKDMEKNAHKKCDSATEYHTLLVRKLSLATPRKKNLTGYKSNIRVTPGHSKEKSRKSYVKTSTPMSGLKSETSLKISGSRSVRFLEHEDTDFS